MGEVLSQNEIDSLLQALSSGELDADDIKVLENEAKKRIKEKQRKKEAEKFNEERMLHEAEANEMIEHEKERILAKRQAAKKKKR